MGVLMSGESKSRISAHIGLTSTEPSTTHLSENASRLRAYRPDWVITEKILRNIPRLCNLAAANSEQMAEVILLAVTKIGIALGNEAINQASLKFKKFITQLTELQGSMGRIRRELRLMHEFLCRMDVRNRNNQAYEIWVQEVRMLVHGIQDIVDEYLHLVGPKHDTGWGTYLKKGCKQPNVLFSLNRIAASVKEVEVNLVHLFQAKDRWVLMASGGSSSDNSSYIVERSQHLASISRSLGEEHLVGVESNKRTLVQWLEGDKLERSVIALHGMGGLGKTTLVANVYRKVREKFECHAWVSISQTYSIQDVLKCLMDELIKDRRNSPGKIDLQDEVRGFLQDKKYLIVLDDVWAPEAVNDLFGALVQNLKGSRILVTTRIDDVAHLASQDRRITLKPLSEKDSCQLFYKTAFPRETNHPIELAQLTDQRITSVKAYLLQLTSVVIFHLSRGKFQFPSFANSDETTFPRETNHECPTELKQLADQIINKCEGIPLAIVSVGRLISVRDKTKEELKRIHDQLDWELINNPCLEHVRNILYLSYIYLPTQLKSCFLYCSLFPEDYVLKRKRLIRLWIAEGFIEKKGESTLEEVAVGYLNELVHRNMLQVKERMSFARVKSFQMHDMVRDLAVDLCQRECFGVAYQEDKYGGESLQEKDGRRLVMHKLTSDIQQSISSIHHLRSVITLDSGIPSSTLLSSVSKNSRYMSVLELIGLPIETVPDAIGDLFNLRHLGLRNSKVKLLPKSIEKLSNLLTLDLAASDIQGMPQGIVKLKKLRHLYAEKASDRTGREFQCRSGVCIPKGLGNLIDLQTLKALKAQDESIGELGDLRQLRTIKIWNVKRVFCERLCGSLVQMRFLSSLSLAASNENEVLQLNDLDPFPPNLHKLILRGKLAEGTFDDSLFFQTNGQNLYSLRLYWSQLREDPLPCLSQLSSLTDLWLTRAYNGVRLEFINKSFPKLKRLVLRDLPNLRRLEIQQGAMASLEDLILINLSSMTEVPPGIEFLKPLQYLVFREITSDFLTLLRECPRIGGMRWQHSVRD